MKMTSKLVTALAFAVGVAAAPLQAMAEYPEKPITIVFPNKAGSGYHNILLALLNEMEDEIPVPVNVVAMPGAGTSAGTRHVHGQAADGYTLLFIHEAIMSSAAMGMLDFEPLDEFRAIARINTTCSGLFTRVDAPYDNLNELAQYTQENPDAVKGAVNTGAISHVEILWVADVIGANIRPVHVGGGSAGYIQAMLAGDIDLFSAGPEAAKGLIDADKVKALAYFGTKHHQSIPDTQTVSEQGFDGQTSCIGGYFWIRKDAPQEAVAYWNNILKATLDEETIGRLEEIIPVEFTFMGDDDINPYAQKQWDVWSKLIEENIKR